MCPVPGLDQPTGPFSVDVVAVVGVGGSPSEHSGGVPVQAIRKLTKINAFHRMKLLKGLRAWPLYTTLTHGQPHADFGGSTFTSVGWMLLCKELNTAEGSPV